jgi:hypothetical protein
MRIVKGLGIAGGMVAAALVGGTLISAASASPSSSSAPPAADPVGSGSSSAYCDQWRQAFADQLGVSVDALTPAAKAATEATIDAAVANGDLPADIGERMKTALDNASGDGCRLLGAGIHAWGRHAAIGDWRHDWVAAAADVLGIAPADLTKDLRSGQSLTEIADAAGVSYDDVTKAIVDATTADLDALVTAGDMTQDRADALLKQLTDRLASGDFPPLFDAPQRTAPGGSNQPLRIRLFGGTPAQS